MISMSVSHGKSVVILLAFLYAFTILAYRAKRFDPPPKYAFGTLLAGAVSDKNMSEPYFVAARMLTYQLLHAQETRSRSPIPFIIAVLPDCHPDKRDRLIRDGATVVEVEPLERDWIVPDYDRWRHEMAKLRFWEMTAYNKICFLDADTILTAPLDRIFDEDESNPITTISNTDSIQPDEAPLPASYGFAAITQTWVEHDFPPIEADFQDPGVMNAGFFVLTPSLELFQYYLSLLDIPGRFSPGLPEQGLLNYAHRLGGNMPWQRLKTFWNVMAPTLRDYHGGARTMHDKWWAPRNAEVHDLFHSIRWRMEGYFERMDGSLQKLSI